MVFFQPSGRRLGDFDIVEKGGRLYCLFIDRAKKDMIPESPVGNNYGLAVSSDGFNWKYEGSVFEGKSGWNSGSLWALDVFSDQGEYKLLYSALETLKGEDHHDGQQVGLAISSDLKKWEDEGVVISNDMTGEFYSPKGEGKFCWRDPYMFKVDSEYYCLLAARDVAKEHGVGGCVALFKSKNLRKWETLKPVFSPGKYGEVEVPSLYELDGKWFLLFGVCEQTDIFDMKYAKGDNPLGPFVEPEGNELLPTMCYMGKIVEFGGEKLLYHWVRNKKSDRTETYLAPPKIVVVEGEKLKLKKHPGLEKYWKGVEKTVSGTKEVYQEGKFREVYVDDYLVECRILVDNPE